MGCVAETKVPPQDDAALYAAADDTPDEARVRRSLARLFFLSAPVFMGQPPDAFPHLAAEVAMRIVAPVLAEVRKETRREYTVAVREAADKRLAGRLAVIEAAARASERAACVAQLRGGQYHLAAMALEAAGVSSESVQVSGR